MIDVNTLQGSCTDLAHMLITIRCHSDNAELVKDVSEFIKYDADNSYYSAVDTYCTDSTNWPKLLKHLSSLHPNDFDKPGVNWFTVADIVARFGVSDKSVRIAMRSGKLKPDSNKSKAEMKYIFDTVEVVNWLESRKTISNGPGRMAFLNK